MPFIKWHLSFMGRTKQVPFLVGMLLAWVEFYAIMYIGSELNNIYIAFFFIIPIWFHICLIFKRYRDAGFPAWWGILAFIPVINIASILCLIFLPSKFNNTTDLDKDDMKSTITTAT
jgi:uncharacterized membrane protein YhaH (DUF805 family)